jgi:hypothetical protein
VRGVEHLAPARFDAARRHHTPGLRHLSAACALVGANGYASVMPDDEHHLPMFGDAHSHGRTVPLSEGLLPAGMKQRNNASPTPRRRRCCRAVC